MSPSDNESASRDHFSRLVAKWSQLGPPLRPSPDDTAEMQRLAGLLAPGAEVVVLGLTPEIIGCEWPRATRLVAVDRSPAMIRTMWPPPRAPVDARVLEADWLDMPLPTASVDLVAGDACYTLMTYPQGYAALTAEVCRVLRPAGIFAIRMFLRPQHPESVRSIAEDLSAGRIGSVHALKLRLLAALHGHSGAGSLLHDAWEAWASMPPVPAGLAGRPGWTPGEIAGLDAYRGLDVRYHLPTLGEFRDIVPGELEEAGCAFGHYELAERCPTLVFARRD